LPLFGYYVLRTTYKTFAYVLYSTLRLIASHLTFRPESSDRFASCTTSAAWNPFSTVAFGSFRDRTQSRKFRTCISAALSATLDLTSTPLTIDDFKGGWETTESFYEAWTRQHTALHIAPNDLISDKGDEVYNALRLRGVRNVLILGVHANMCVLNRPFAIKQLTKWGFRCILVRDLTDAMYNPQDRPYVSHQQGTQLVIEHIEKYWAPTVLSPDLVRAAHSN